MKMYMIIEEMFVSELEMLINGKSIGAITNLDIMPNKDDPTLFDAVVEIEGGYKGADERILSTISRKPEYFFF